MPDRTFSYDVFLSHNRAQKDWTRKLAVSLDEKGIKVWFDEWCLPAGTVASKGMELGVEQSRHIVLVLSPEFLDSEWTDFETQIGIVLDPANRERKLVPILYSTSDVPLRISRISWIDFRDTHRDDERYAYRLQQLLGDLRPELYQRPKDFERFQEQRHLAGHEERPTSSLATGSAATPRASKQAPADQTYDVFLSYAHPDADSVERLGTRLEDEAQLRVWLDQWRLVPGEHWQQEMAQGLNQAKSCAVFLGSRTPEGWFREEIEKALNRQTKDKTFRVIPVLLPQGNRGLVDNFLDLRTWVDFTKGLTDGHAFHVLVSGIRGVPPGRYQQNEINDDQADELIRKQLVRIRALRKEQLIDDDVALEYQRRILNQITGSPERE